MDQNLQHKMINFIYVNVMPFLVSHRSVRSCRKLFAVELRATNQQPAKTSKNKVLQGIFGLIIGEVRME